MQETRTVKLKMPLLPKINGELAHMNQFLKVFSIISLLLVLMTISLLFFAVIREPTVITLDYEGKALNRTDLPKVEDQIREGVKRYLENRYQWEPGNVIKKLKESEEFITPQALKAFQGAVSNVAKFSVEKIVSQKIYPEKIEIDLKKGTAFITGDRVTSIQGLKAAGNLRLELTFETGPRTLNNPWGLYISKEREE